MFGLATGERSRRGPAARPWGGGRLVTPGESSFGAELGRRIRSERRALAGAWAHRLRDRGPARENPAPSQDGADRVSDLLGWIADFVAGSEGSPAEPPGIQDPGGGGGRFPFGGLGERLEEHRVLSEILLDLAEEVAADPSAAPGPREVARGMRRLVEALARVRTAAVRSFEEWRARYDRERRDLLVTHSQVLSHELGNRLGPAETAVELLRSRLPQDSDRRMRLYSLVGECLQAGLRTVEDVSALGRALPMDEQAGISLWLVVKESVRLAARDAGEVGIDLSVSGEVPRAQVPGPAVRIALSNALSNARRWHRPEGGDRWIRVSARRVEGARPTSGGTLEIVVEDNGPGVPAGAATASRGGASEGSSRGNGSGLGLAVSREVLGRAGGAMAVEERAGGGSRVVLTVPELPGDPRA